MDGVVCASGQLYLWVCAADVEYKWCFHGGSDYLTDTFAYMLNYVRKYSYSCVWTCFGVIENNIGDFHVFWLEVFLKTVKIELMTGWLGCVAAPSSSKNTSVIFAKQQFQAPISGISECITQIVAFRCRCETQPLCLKLGEKTAQCAYIFASGSDSAIQRNAPYKY